MVPIFKTSICEIGSIFSQFSVNILQEKKIGVSENLQTVPPAVVTRYL